MKPLVLIVDDEQGILTTLSHVLEDEGFRTLATRSGEEAVVSTTSGALRALVAEVEGAAS